jgi:V8-like Glu-specific endopeptidase
MARQSVSILLGAQILSALTPGLVQARSIYGEDDRLDLYESSPKMQLLAKSTVAFLEAQSFTEKSSQEMDSALFSIDSTPLGENENLCKGERFWEQPNAAFCSGSLVGPDLILTAGHCIEDQNACDNARIVFDYAVTKKGEYPKEIEKQKVFRCRSIVERTVDSVLYKDFAIIRLDRAVTDRVPLKVSRRSANLERATPVAVIGHPTGLPTKVTTGTITSTDRPESFESTVDTFAGNSGSPVFNLLTQEIEGILTYGTPDYESTNTNPYEFDETLACRHTIRYPEKDPRDYSAPNPFMTEIENTWGEKSTRVEMVSSLQPLSQDLCRVQVERWTLEGANLLPLIQPVRLGRLKEVQRKLDAQIPMTSLPVIKLSPELETKPSTDAICNSKGSFWFQGRNQDGDWVLTRKSRISFSN